MLTKTPFLPGIPTLLCGSAKRKNQDIANSEFKELAESDLNGLSQQLSAEIPAQLLQSLSETKRDRIYSNSVTFWAFLGQVLSDDKSCKRAVSRVQQWFKLNKKPVPSPETKSFCDARYALPENLLQEVHQHIYDQLDKELPIDSQWRGFSVHSEDGTSAHMPDTPANQEKYPQSPTQDEGCGFPIVKLGGLINLGHGGLRDFTTSDLNTSEHKAHAQLDRYLGKGDLLIGDRLYSSYEIVAGLLDKGVAYIGRHHQARKIDFRKGKRIGKNQRLQVWTKPAQQQSGSCLTEEQWDAMPDTLEMRIIRTKGPDREGKKRTLYIATTLHDVTEYPAEEIASLYAHRWEIELRYRDIKTTLGMDMLRTKKPDMVEKEILMYMIAYNLIRLLMLKAGNLYCVNHRRISFKATIQIFDEARVNFITIAGKPRLLAKAKEAMLSEISDQVVKERPGRSEPRHKKRRFKPYGWIQKPRHQYFSHYVNENPPTKILDQCP